MIGAHAFSPGTSWDEALGYSYCSDIGSLLLKTILKRQSPIVSHSTEGTKYLQSRMCHPVKLVLISQDNLPPLRMNGMVVNF